MSYRFDRVEYLGVLRDVRFYLNHIFDNRGLQKLLDAAPNEYKKIYAPNNKRWKRYSKTKAKNEDFFEDYYFMQTSTITYNRDYDIYIIKLWKDALRIGHWIKRDSKNILSQARYIDEKRIKGENFEENNRKWKVVYIILLWLFSIIENMFGPYGALSITTSQVQMPMYNRALQDLYDFERFFERYPLSSFLYKIKTDSDVEEVKKQLGVLISTLNIRYSMKYMKFSK